MSPRNKYRIALAVLAIAFLLWQRLGHRRAGDAAAGAAPDVVRLLQLKPCSLASPFASQPIEAQCGTFSVPEDRARPQGRKIALNVAWVAPENVADARPDPVVFLAGGPGQSAVESYPMLSPVFADVLNKRGVLLVDQRGTGKSNLLSCRQPDDDAPKPADKAQALALEDELTRACLAELSTRADLARYTTTDAVADLEAIRIAMQAPAFNLIGVSYGTRVAQQYALHHPATTRTVTLDSPVPNTLGLGNIFARNLDDALAAQFAQCKENPACARAMGDPRTELQSLLARLRAAPVEVSYRDAATGEQKTGTLGADDVAGLVRMYAYMPASSALLPQLVHEANQGRYGGLMALAHMLRGEMKDAMAMGMQLSVVCSEDAASMVANAADVDTVLGNDVTDAMARACALWPKGGKPADFNTPLSGTLPVLVLSGEFDPVTPPRYGEEIAKTLPNGRWLTLKGQGHNVIGAGCMPKLFAQFIESADAKALDAKCLDTLPPLLPFTSFNGWDP